MTNCTGRTSARPAASTNSLNGAGGGSSAGTISASSAVAAIERQRALDVAGLQPLAQKRLAALLGEVVDHEAARPPTRASPSRA